MSAPLHPAAYPTQYLHGSHPNQDPRPQFNPSFHQSFSQSGASPSKFPQELQIQAQQNPQQLYQQFQQQHAAYARPQPGGGAIAQGTNIQTSTPAPQTPQINQAPTARPPSAAPNGPQTPAPSSSNGTTKPANMMQQRPTQGPNPLVQQAQLQNAASAPHAIPQLTTPMSPQSAARERARVTVLLEINSFLLQEVISLQSQGKAGSTPAPAQQSPTSPTSATDPTLSNSPDPSKAAQNKPASQEYADCMRRLQVNLAYLASLADAKKKATGSIPPHPAIMAPPRHLLSVTELYKKLNMLFPEATQPATNKPVPTANGAQLHQTQD